MSGTRALWLLTSQRSGSNYLRTLLDSTGVFEGLGEIFEWSDSQLPGPFNWFVHLARCYGEDPGLVIPTRRSRHRLMKLYLERVGRALAPGRIPVPDVKYDSTLHLNPLWRSPLKPPYLLKLLGEQAQPVLHLVRRGVLRRYVSSLFVHAAGRHHLTRGERVPPVRVRVETDGLVGILEQARAEIGFFRQALAQHPAGSLEIAYEEIEDGAEAAGARLRPGLEALLGRPIPGFKESPLQKLIRHPRDVVENWDEVVRALTGTEFEAELA